MNILVCISKTPETTANIAFEDNNSKFTEAGVNFIMNPYDEWYALVRGLELKEAHGGKLTVINVGPASNDIVIRKALAIGADEAVRIDAEPISSDFVARQIAHYAKDQSYDVVLCGKESIDYNGSETPAMIAELLDLPFVSYASKMEIEGNSASIARDIEGGVENIKVKTPFVISAAKGLAEQRIPNMRGIMMAKRKPLQVVAAADLTPAAQVNSYELPPQKSSVKMIDADNMGELVRLLHEEAKVI